MAIDYQKLQLAHELAEKLREMQSREITIVHTFWDDSSPPYQLFIGEPDYFDGNSINNLDLDSLIMALQELTQPKPKYEIGQTVWFNDGQTPESFEIGEKDIKFYTGSIKIEYSGIAEEDIYPTMESLIDAQIQYWKSLKVDAVLDSGEITLEKACEHPLTEKAWEADKGTVIRCLDCDELIKDFCKHESNQGMFRAGIREAYEYHYKCIKCGEFYR